MSRHELSREISGKRKGRIQGESFAKDYDPMRRLILRAGFWGMIIALGGGLSYLVREAMEPDSNEELILSEAKRLGIHPDLEEQFLWSTSYLNTSHSLSATTENSELMKDRADNTLARMSKSKNPHFKKAYDDLFILVQSERVKLDWLPIRSGASRSIGEVRYGVGVTEQLKYELNISRDFVLNDSNALTLAGAITHEVEHIRRLEDFISLFPELTPSEQVTKLNQHLQKKEQRDTEETFSYGTEAEAYIYQAGLLGSLYDVRQSEQDDQAAAFVRFGRDANSPQWKNYLIKARVSHLSK